MPKANLKGTVSLDDSAFSAGVRRVKMASASLARNVGKGFKEIGTTITRISASLAKFAAIAGGITFAAATAGAYKLSQALKGAFDTGGALSDLSAQTGVAVKDLVILQDAFEKAGVGADQVGITLNRLTRRTKIATEGNNSYAKALKTLGLEADELSKMGQLERFLAVGERMKVLGVTSETTAAAMDLLDTSAGKLFNLFQNAGAMEDATRSMGTAGKILQDNAETFDRISDLLNRSGAKLRTFVLGVAEVAAPRLLEALEKFNDMDFAAMGQNFVQGFNIEKLSNALAAGMELAVGVFGNAMIKTITAVATVFGKLMSKEGREIMKDLTVSQFMPTYEQFQKMQNGESIVGDRLSKLISDTFAQVQSNVGQTGFDTSEAQSRFFSALKDLVGIPTGRSPKSESDLYDKELAAQKERIKADEAAMQKMKQDSQRSRLALDLPIPLSDKEVELRKQAMKASTAATGDAFGNRFLGLAGAAGMQLERLMGIGPGQNTALTMGPKTFGSRAGAISRANLNGLAGQGLGATRRIGAAAEATAKRRDETIGGTNQRLDKQLTAIEEGNRYLKKGLDQ